MAMQAMQRSERAVGGAVPDVARAMFKLKKPCRNCPFNKKGAIQLAPGRLLGIVADLLADDMRIFHCHVTAHSSKTGGEFDDERGTYTASNKESFCYGAMVYLEKVGRPSVAQRLAAALGLYRRTEVLAQAGDIIDEADLAQKG